MPHDDEILKMLLEGMSQAEIARALGLRRNDVHFIKNRLIDQGRLDSEKVVKYKRKKKKKLANELLLPENATAKQKYIKMYKAGDSVAWIIQKAKEDGVKSPSRVIAEILAPYRKKGRLIRDYLTKELLVDKFKGKGFVWALVEKELMLVPAENMPQTTTNENESVAAKALYDDFSRYASIPYITWLKWVEKLDSSILSGTRGRGCTYANPHEMVEFLNQKFQLVAQESLPVTTETKKIVINSDKKDEDEEQEDAKIATNQ
jgi:hypothetical protein